MGVTVLPADSDEALRVAGGRQGFADATLPALTWTRPSDWLSMPSVTSTENKFVGLVAITDDDNNFVAFSSTSGTSSAPAFASINSGSSSTDATSYTTASITLTAGRLYLLSVENSHGTDATAVSSVTGSTGVPNFLSRATTQFNTNQNRVSLWSVVPASTYTGTLTINFGGTTQTGACWSVVEVQNAATAVGSDGIVQSGTATGSSGTSSVTLSALAYSGNSTFGVQGHASTAASTAGSGYTEVHDVTTATPAQALQTEYRVTGSTTVDATFTSAAWGAIGVEIARRTYTVDWGDGTTEVVASGTTAQRQYTYSSISSSTASTRGYRQVTISATPNDPWTTLSLQVKHSQTALTALDQKWLDVIISGPSLTTITIGASTETVRLNGLERVQILSSAKTTWLNQFYNCRGLQSVSVASSGTVTSTNSMFSGCSSLRDAPGLTTSSVTNFGGMFYQCYSLPTVPRYDTATATDTSYMFYQCYALQSVPLFDTRNVTAMNNMFESCAALRTIPCFDTGKVTNFTNFASGCSRLTAVPPLNTAAATLMFSAFSGTAIRTFPLLNTASVTSMNSMVANCVFLREFPSLNTASVTGFTNMFNGCRSLQTGPTLTTSAATNMNSMFLDCSAMTSVPAYSTGSVTNTGSMFSGCSSLMTVPLMDTANVTDMSSMFSNCSSLQTVPAFDTGKVTTFQNMFNGCYSLQAIPLLNAATATSVTTMFGSCATLAKAAMTGLTRGGQTFSATALSQTAIESVFDNAGKASGAQTLTILSCWGAAGAVSKTSSGTTSGSTTVTMADTSGLSTGWEISGTGITTAVAVTMQDTGDTVTRTAHGIADGTLISFATIVTTTGIATYTPYYVVNGTANTFQVSDTLGGAAKALTSDGSGTIIYGTTITAINPNVSVTLSIPASATGSITTTSYALKRSKGTLKGYTLST